MTSPHTRADAVSRLLHTLAASLGFGPRRLLLSLVVTLAALASAQDWQLQEIDRGTKPALGLTPDGTPLVVYMLERLEGWVKVARLEGDVWMPDTIASGYFYGPPDIAVDADGVPHVAYHDHQAPRFDPGRGDASYATVLDGAWLVGAAADSGHDGWDNRIVVDGEGRPHMSAVDPLEFGGVGVEYYALGDDGVWQVEAVGSGPQTYKYATSLGLGPDGRAHVSYHDGSAKSLVLATRDEGGWTLETVDAQGDTGLFSALAVDAQGGLHLSYLERTGERSGVVRYAHRPAGGDWTLEEVGTLEALFFGFTGARNVTSLAVDDELRPWIAYGDEAGLHLAVRGEGGWAIETVVETGVEAGAAPLGQIVSLGLDRGGRPHLAYSVVSDRNELDGTVWYATRR